MTYWCIENLRRLPEEVDAPLEALMRGITATNLMRERERRAMSSGG